ncbi:hypothetical protein [Methanobrevibacter sp. DSM 116169]|uniref:hypothetical protein n=1 Tax=Methanobrevibacter sp. DSM 116169 TaxID=3242727 RepID=UPI0038FCAD89
MIIQNQKDIENFHKIRGHSKTTITNYKNSLKKYSKFHNISISKLIEEAINEQKEKIPHHELKIYNRILDFRTDYLIPNFVNNSVLSHETRIKTFYRCFRIEVPNLPPINKKILKKNPIITYDDILTKEELIKGLKHSNKYLKSRIMMMISSGTAIQETQNITKKDFYKSTYSYHKSENLEEALKY